MLLTKAQSEIAKDLHRFRVLNCGRRFGKTTLAIEEIKGFALAKESRIAYIAPTIQQARDIAWGMLKKELKPITVKSREAPSLELEVLNTKGTTSTIILRGWEAIETVRGQAFDFIVVDEIAQMRNFWTGWDEVLSPTLIDRKGSVMFISTPKGFNHFYDLYNKELTDSDFKSFHYTSYDNPHVPKEEIDREKLSRPDLAFSQEYLATFTKQEGLIYKEFSRKLHVFEDNNLIKARTAETIIGVDFGYTNPTAMITVNIDSDRRYWITNEWYKSGKTNAEIIEYAKTLGAVTFYPDPAEPDRIEEMKRAQLHVREVNKDVTKGIDTVQMLLKTGRLKVHKSCLNLISEFETYTYKDPTPSDSNPEEPLKEHDHALDALRYALYMKEPEPMADLEFQARILRNRATNTRPLI